MTDHAGHVLAGVCVLIVAAGGVALTFAIDAWGGQGYERTTLRWILLVFGLGFAAVLAVMGVLLIVGVWRTRRD